MWSLACPSIPNFYTASGHQANYDSTKDGLCARNDLEELKPCCGMTDYFAISGVAPVTDSAAA
eukprot:scaffold59230_cov38-Prasinocladus_malaysianus.AAC.1